MPPFEGSRLKCAPCGGGGVAFCYTVRRAPWRVLRGRWLVPPDLKASPWVCDALRASVKLTEEETPYNEGDKVRPVGSLPTVSLDTCRLGVRALAPLSLFFPDGGMRWQHGTNCSL